MPDICSYDHDLEDHIEMLRKLDEARQNSADLRDQGIDALLEYLHQLEALGNCRREVSLVARALQTRMNQPFKDEEEERSRTNLINVLINRLKSGLTLDELKTNKLSVLEAASSLRAMAANSGDVFSIEATYCYYWIIRELYTADRGDWNIGGARASPTSTGQVTAFATSECARSLLMFAKTMENAGEFTAEIGNYIERKEHLEQLEKVTFLSKFDEAYFLNFWIIKEKKRASVSCFLKLQKFSRCIALSNQNIKSIKDIENINFDNIKEFVKSAKKDLNIALKNILDFRIKEKQVESDPSNIDDLLDTYLLNKDKILSDLEPPIRQILSSTTRSESAHLIAILAIKQSLDRVIKAETLINNKKITFSDKAKQLKSIFDEAVIDIHKLLRPIKIYLSSIIDRELTHVSLDKSWDWQPSELACAASCYGRLTNEWKKDLRFNHAVNDLSKMISSRGHFANPTTYHKNLEDDTYHQLANSAVLHSLAKLLRFARESEIEKDLADKMLRFFEDTRATKLVNGKKGWTWEFSISPLEPNWEATAGAVLALAEINEMLDVRINHIILEHFSVKEKNNKLKKTPMLDKLFYPDYGLNTDLLNNVSTNNLIKLASSFINQKITGKDKTCKDKKNKFINTITNNLSKEGIKRNEADLTAFTFLRMCAHVSQLTLPIGYDSIFSLFCMARLGPARLFLLSP